MKTLIFCELKKNQNRFLQNWYIKQKIIPTINKIKKRYPSRVIAVDDFSSKLLKKYKISNKSLKDHLSDDISKKINTNLTKFCRLIAPTHGLLMNKLTFLNMNLWDIDEVVIMEYLRPIVEDITSLSTIIKNENPSKIILFEGNTKTARVIKEISNNKGIKLLDISSLLSESISQIKNSLSTFTPHFNKPPYLTALRKKTGEGVEPFFKKQEKRVVFIVATPKWGQTIKNISKNVKDILVIGREKNLGKHYPKLNFRSFEDYASDTTNRNADFHQNYVSHFHEIDSDQSFKSNFTYNGVALFNIIPELFHYLFTFSPEYILTYYYTFQQIILKEKPSVIILFGDRTKFGKTASEISFQYKIPTLIIQPTFIFERAIDGPTKADKIAVFGQQTIDYLISKGGNKDEYVLTGNPKYDEIFNQKYNSVKIKKKYSIKARKKVVVILKDSDQKYIKRLISKLNQNNKYQSIIVENPNDKHELFKLANIIITKNSVIEALLFNKKVIVPQKEKNDLISNAGAIYVDPKKVTQTLNALDIKQHLKNKNLKYLTYGNDGKSHVRISKLIKDTIK
ncbi:hypothetical protein ACFLZX_00800 [Nanoarchaeota archaeon]